MQTYIIRTQKQATAYGRENITPEVKERFQLALDSYSFVLEVGKEYSGDQWVTLIMKHFKPCGRTLSVVNAIREAMPHPITKGEL